MIVIHPGQPLRLPDAVGKKIPQKPEVFCIRLAILDSGQAPDDPMDIARVTVNRVEHGLKYFPGRSRRCPHHETLEEFRHRRFTLVVAFATPPDAATFAVIVRIPPFNERLRGSHKAGDGRGLERHPTQDR